MRLPLRLIIDAPPPRVLPHLMLVLFGARGVWHQRLDGRATVWQRDQVGASPPATVLLEPDPTGTRSWLQISSRGRHKADKLLMETIEHVVQTLRQKGHEVSAEAVSPASTTVLTALLIAPVASAYAGLIPLMELVLKKHSLQLRQSTALSEMAQEWHSNILSSHLILGFWDSLEGRIALFYAQRRNRPAIAITREGEDAEGWRGPVVSFGSRRDDFLEALNSALMDLTNEIARAQEPAEVEAAAPAPEAGLLESADRPEGHGNGHSASASARSAGGSGQPPSSNGRPVEPPPAQAVELPPVSEAPGQETAATSAAVETQAEIEQPQAAESAVEPLAGQEQESEVESALRSETPDIQEGIEESVEALPDEPEAGRLEESPIEPEAVAADLPAPDTFAAPESLATEQAVLDDSALTLAEDAGKVNEFELAESEGAGELLGASEPMPQEPALPSAEDELFQAEEGIAADAEASTASGVENEEPTMLVEGEAQPESDVLAEALGDALPEAEAATVIESDNASPAPAPVAVVEAEPEWTPESQPEALADTPLSDEPALAAEDLAGANEREADNGATGLVVGEEPGEGEREPASIVVEEEPVAQREIEQPEGALVEESQRESAALEDEPLAMPDASEQLVVEADEAGDLTQLAELIAEDLDTVVWPVEAEPAEESPTAEEELVEAEGVEDTLVASSELVRTMDEASERLEGPTGEDERATAEVPEPLLEELVEATGPVPSGDESEAEASAAAADVPASAAAPVAGEPFDLMQERRRIYGAIATDRNATLEQRFHAARVLSESGDPQRAAEMFGTILTARDAQHLAEDAMEELGALGVAAQPILWQLDARTADPERAIEIARQLARAGDTHTALFRLERLVRHQNESVRLSALSVMTDIGHDATLHFERLATSASDPRIRLAAASWLQEQGVAPRQVMATLMELATQTTDTQIAQSSVELMAGREGESASEALLTIAHSSSNPDARLAAAEAVNRRGDTGAARAVLLNLAQGTDDLAADAALDLLVNVSDKAISDTERLMNTAALKSVRRRAAEMLSQPHQPDHVQQAATKVFLALDRPSLARPVLARLATSANDIEIRRWAAQQLALVGESALEDMRAVFTYTDDPVAGQYLAEGLLTVSRLPDDRRRAALWLADHSNLPRAIEVLGDLALSARVSGSDAVKATDDLNRFATQWAGAARTLAILATDSPHPAVRARALDLLLREHPSELPLSLLVDLAVTGTIGSADRTPVIQQLLALAQPAANRIATRLTSKDLDTERHWQLLQLMNELPDGAVTPALLQLTTRAPKNRIRYVAAEQLITRGHVHSGYAALATIAINDPEHSLRERAVYELVQGLPDTELLLRSILERTRYEDTYHLTRGLLRAGGASLVKRTGLQLGNLVVLWNKWVASLPLGWVDRMAARRRYRRRR